MEIMTGKERAVLRAMANNLTSIQQVGKSGIGEELIKNTDAALTAHELIKFGVLKTCPLTAREAAEILAQATGAEIIQVIGYKFVLYRENPDKDKS